LFVAKLIDYFTVYLHFVSEAFSLVFFWGFQGR